MTDVLRWSRHHPLDSRILVGLHQGRKVKVAPRYEAALTRLEEAGLIVLFPSPAPTEKGREYARIIGETS